MPDEERTALVAWQKRSRRHQAGGIVLAGSGPLSMWLAWTLGLVGIMPLVSMYAFVVFFFGLMVWSKGTKDVSEARRLLAVRDGLHVLPPARLIERD